MRIASSCFVALVCCGLVRSARADDGMWPFDMVPKAQIKKDHGVDLTDAWLDHVRLSSVRISAGGSGSFVSSTGLVLTNHHVASDCIAKVSSSGHNYMDEGYLAGKDGAEVSCPDIELDQLQAMEDISDKVHGARAAGMSDSDANVAVKGAMTKQEQECQDRTHLRCEAVTLYAGGKYMLYEYKRYTDVRLVFAPEATLAFFGGDPDNFTYPRFDIDMALFRVYEAGKPLAPAHFLKWSEQGPKENDTVFVSGHPGSTGRLQTKAQLERSRDTIYPFVTDNLKQEAALLHTYGKQSHEDDREARESIFGVENSIKALTGYQGGLKDPALMKQKADDEAALVKAIKADAKLSASYGATFDDVAKVQTKVGAIYKQFSVLERGGDSSILQLAKTLVRLPDELAQPNEKRLREYRDSALDSLKLELFSGAAVYGGVEVVLVRAWMENAARVLVGKPILEKILHGKTPAVAAQELVASTRLFDVYTRRQLFAGGKPAIDASTDPAIVLMRALDLDARAVRKDYEDTVEAPMRALGEKVAQATFAVRGPSMPPDATFTLRLSTGVAKGYKENGKDVPWATDFAGMYAHATGKDPFKLPQKILDAKPRLTPTTKVNFVSTDDIIGGNSGSPVIAVDGSIVGLIFDGNISSLPNRFVYREVTERAVSVDTAAMTEALSKVYGADTIVKELTGH